MPAEEGVYLSGIILAAGTSERMGRLKQLELLGGRSLLQRVLDEAASSCLDELIVVLGHRAEEIRAALQLPSAAPCRIVVNPDFAEGQSSSLRAGLRAANPSAGAAAILLGDQPFVTATVIDGVAQAFLEAGSLAARPVYRKGAEARVPGHPVFLARPTWAELERQGGDRGARDLLAARPEWLHPVVLEGDPPLGNRHLGGPSRRQGPSG